MVEVRWSSNDGAERSRHADIKVAPYQRGGRLQARFGELVMRSMLATASPMSVLKAQGPPSQFARRTNSRFVGCTVIGWAARALLLATQPLFLNPDIVH